MWSTHGLTVNVKNAIDRQLRSNFSVDRPFPVMTEQVLVYKFQGMCGPLNRSNAVRDKPPSSEPRRGAMLDHLYRRSAVADLLHGAL